MEAMTATLLMGQKARRTNAAQLADMGRRPALIHSVFFQSLFLRGA